MSWYIVTRAGKKKFVKVLVRAQSMIDARVMAHSVLKDDLLTYDVEEIISGGQKLHIMGQIGG